MSDFERVLYQSMSSEARCLVWIVKAMDMQEYGGLMTPADQKLLRKIIEGMVKEAQGRHTRLEFFMPMLPPTATHQEKKWRVVKGKPVSYEPAEVKAARSKLTAHLSAHKPGQPMEGPVRLLVKWCFPRSESHYDGEYRASKPDTDNLQKLLKDCMTAVGFWKDDAQVASEICEKFWADLPGIYVCMEQIGQDAPRRPQEAL